MLVERIIAFIRGASGDRFDELALELFRFEYERSEVFRDLCEERGATPARVSGWRQVPALPAAALPAPAPPARDLERATIDSSFVAACLEGMERPPLLSLVPTAEEPAAPGAHRLAERLLEAWAAPDSQLAAARRGPEVARARSFLAARQRDRRPTLILAPADALERLLEALERRGLRFRLPPGSRVVMTGRGEGASRELLTRLADGLAVAPEAVLREYAADGLVSRFYAGHGPGGEPRPFPPPPWTRVRLVDPETLVEAPPGAVGTISVFDLAAVGSLPHLLTGDPGTGGAEGFRPAGAQAGGAAGVSS